MSHFGDYIDGVPVKISEKYKRPPRIELPYSVIESSARAQDVVDRASHCCTFETNVLAKVRELRSAKETKKNERRHRLQLLEEAKQKKLDAIAAAEAEEKLKQLSVSEVSYPSTDEISPLTPDEKHDKNCDTTPRQDNSPEFVEATTSTDANYPSCSRAVDSQPNILQPIQVQTNYQQHSLLDDPNPLEELKLTRKMSKIHYNPNVDALTYKDFENDTSSPFDNVELKTINEMELLAQVLQSQRESSTSCPAETYIPEQNYTQVTNCASQAQLSGMTYMPNSYIETNMQDPNMIYSSPQHYPMNNGYYVPTDNANACDNMPMDNMYMPNYQYYVPPNAYTVDPNYYSPQMPGNEVVQVPNGSPYIPQPYYYQYPQVPVPYPSISTMYTTHQNEESNSIPSQSFVKSRSRSVPDIVNELNEELESARLRATERSYNASPAPKSIPRSSSSSDKKNERRRRKLENLPNPFDKMPQRVQEMCKKIHSMGFPLGRVARVCSIVGDNDKKIIEGLLMVGDLMDLGFSEGRVSAALAKHEFNKDKALDELVSL